MEIEDLIIINAEAIARFYGARIKKERQNIGQANAEEKFIELLNNMLDIAGLSPDYFVCGGNE